MVCPPALCYACENQVGSHVIDRTEVVHLSNVHIIFEYAGMIRDLIWKAKIKNDPVALGLLLRFSRQHALGQLNTFNDPLTLVCPAPASFWGRLRGRFDVAEMFARTCFPRASILTGSAAGGIFRAKRAGRNSKNVSNGLIRIKSLFNSISSNGSNALIERISTAKRILVVDDVMTSGFTMKTQISQLKELGAQSVYGLVIASPGRLE